MAHKHRYRTIKECYRALSRYDHDPEHPRVQEIQENIELIRERNRGRRVQIGVNLRDVTSIEARKRWIEKKRRTVQHYQDEIDRGRNPRYYSDLIGKAQLDIAQWETEIRNLEQKNA